MNYYFEDFTEENYRSLLKIAKKYYNFIFYDDYKLEGQNVLWRHDIDFSAHRALRLAQIEAEEGVSSTFFILLHSEYYNLLEKEISQVIFEIINLGHKIGLHFDPTYYQIISDDNKDYGLHLDFERNFLNKVFKIDIKAFSYHNPIKDFMISSNEVAGMINCYSKYFTDHYSYCSDSNGFWRFKRLEDFIEDNKNNRVQVLTHPEWWVPEVMSPRDRISRCIDGRAIAQHTKYDIILNELGRENVGK